MNRRASDRHLQSCFRCPQEIGGILCSSATVRYERPHLSDQHLTTHCLTIGRRPDLLALTLGSLRSLPPMPTLAINDFGDTETNEVFSACCPDGRLVGPGHRLGHHGAVDELYRYVETPFIFHNEDDWGFGRTDFLADALQLLEADPSISCVCLRDTDDMPMDAADRSKIKPQEVSGISYQRLDALHRQWHGFTFNPHIIRKSIWEEVGGYSSFEKERHLSRYLRAQGRYVAFLLPAGCVHIGDGRSTHLKPPTRFKRFKNWLRGR